MLYKYSINIYGNEVTTCILYGAYNQQGDFLEQWDNTKLIRGMIVISKPILFMIHVKLLFPDWFICWSDAATPWFVMESMRMVGPWLRPRAPNCAAIWSIFALIHTSSWRTDLKYYLMSEVCELWFKKFLLDFGWWAGMTFNGMFSDSVVTNWPKLLLSCYKKIRLRWHNSP